MERNVCIIGTGSYSPKNHLSKEHFIKHFEKFQKGKQAEAILNVLGRDRMPLVDKDENNLTMSVEAARRAFIDAEISPNDIDMIISASDTPEYLSPSCAMMIKNELKADNVMCLFDMNNDCLAMLNAIDIAVNYLKVNKKYRRVLIVSSVALSPFAMEDDILVYSAVSDGASAVILEAVEENKSRGFISSKMIADTSFIHTVRFPVCGMSNIYDENIQIADKKMRSVPFDFTFISEKWANLITDVLNDCQYSPSDVSHYIMSQFSYTDIEDTLRLLGDSVDKATFIADKYGYTGCASPIMALDYRLKNDKFCEDDLIVFCSAGAGYTAGALLYKW